MQNESSIPRIGQVKDPKDFVKDFENDQRSDIKRKSVMANFHSKKASLGDQAKITRFSNPQQQEK